jgi:hypothetical protein
MAIRNRHYDWNHGAVGRPGGSENRDRSEGVISMISQEGRGGGFPVVSSHPVGDTAAVAGHQGLDRIAAGEFDAGFNAAFRDFRAHGAPVIYRLFMEMNSPTPRFTQTTKEVARLAKLATFEHGGTSGSWQTRSVRPHARLAT